MKKVFFLLFLFPAASLAQKIQVSTYDKTSKSYIIETSGVQVKVDLDDIFGLKIRSQDTLLLLIAEGVGETARNISAGDPLIFFLSRGDSAVSISVRDQGYKKGSFADNYIHFYSISKNELMKIQRSSLMSIRMYTATGFKDIKIKDKRSELLQELVPVFLQEYNTKSKQFGSSTSLH